MCEWAVGKAFPKETDADEFGEDLLTEEGTRLEWVLGQGDRSQEGPAWGSDLWSPHPHIFHATPCPGNCASNAH